MKGKIVAIGILATAVAVGAGVYYFSNFAYYEPVEDPTVSLTSLVSETPEEILIDEIEAIDAFSSPIRFRACFSTPMSQALLTETYEVFEAPEPRNAPPWFDCFDADAIAEGLADGSAIAFTGTRNIQFGIDRVVAVFADGRGYVWHQLNDCGEKLYDGSPASDDCPERDL